MTVNINNETCSEDELEKRHQKHINEKALIVDIVNPVYISPCANACPAGINIPGFLSLIAANRLEDAYHVIKRNNPFPYTCGLVCPHPCEDQCRRAEVGTDRAVNICNLKGVTAEHVMNLTNPSKELILPKKGKSVGIVGGGPSGMTSAYYLAKLGYDVTVYETQPFAGGMTVTGIPQYRAPMDVIQWEIKRITDVGVKLLTGTEVGKDVQFDELAKKHQAIYISAGMPKGTFIGLEGEKAKEVYQAVDFLRDVKLGLHEGKPLPPIGKKVVVIGGGNVAVDVARSVKRMGVDELTMICLEQRHEMPAWEHEVNACVDEDVAVNNGWGPKKVIVDKDNHVKGIIFKQCTDVFDENKRFNPQYCEDETIEYKADTIIMAIGQSADSTYIPKEFLKNPEDERSRGIELFRGKWVVADPETMETGKAGIFAGGDVMKPGLMVEAIGHGRKAAQSIDIYLGGAGELYVEDGIEIPIPQLDSKNWKYQRKNMASIDMDERISTFKEESIMISPQDGMTEANRCIGCDIMQFDAGRCIGCGKCVKNCPAKAISFISWEQDYVFGTREIRKAKVDPRLCECCGMCLSECPVNAISTANWDDNVYSSIIETFAKK